MKHDLKDKTVLVTGATGFLGGALARRLARDGVNVRAMARRPNRDQLIKDIDGIEVVIGNILDYDRMQQVMEGCDTVFHVAAALGGSLNTQREVNTFGTRNVMWAATHTGVRHVVYVSTIAVYGYNYRYDVTENNPPDPGYDPYQITKTEAESAVRGIAIQSSLTYSIIRPAMIYGPNSSAWTKTMFRLAKRKPTPFIGSGAGTAYPIHVDDVVDMMIELAVHPQAVGETFNCSPDPAPTWREFIGAYSRLDGHNWWLPLPLIVLQPFVFFIWLFSPTYSSTKQVAGVVRLVRNDMTYKMDKARDLLGWEPKITLEDGVKSCAPYLREQGLLR